MDATPITVVTEDEMTVEGFREADDLFVPEDVLAAATSWELKPQGLCQAAVCVPVRDRRSLGPDGLVGLVALGAAVRRPTAIEAELGLAVLGTTATEAAESMRSLQAPDFTLPDLHGNPVSLSDFDGRKRLLIAFASW